ncbi:MAG TPA: PEP-CTERM sorting domain-containing protein [Candidatus Methylacidiphilales bacterium]
MSTTLAPVRFLAPILLAATIMGAGAAHGQTLIYRQTFGNAGAATSLAAQGIDWTELYTTTGNSAAPDNWLKPNPTIGLTTDVNVGAASGSASTYYQQNYGYYSQSTINTAGKYAVSAYTTSLTLDPTASTYSFSWYQRNSTDLSQSVRLLLQVGGVWYVSQTAFQTALSTTTLESFTYSPTASNWFVLSTGTTPTNASAVTSSGAFNLSTAPTSNLSGNITAMGLFLDNPYDASTAYLSVDSFAVYSTAAVPEPGTWLLLAVGGVAVLGMARRRLVSA